jgi:hypothetical protein
MLKTVSSITNAIGALNYKGVWNATTNTPALASGVGTKGDYYVVSVAGSTNLDGETLWGVGDWAVYNGAAWQKVEGGNTINATTVSASTSVTTPVIQATSSAGGTLKNNGGTAQLQWGSGGGSNLSLEVATNINPANAAVAISPTGTGTVTINPAAASTMNNVAIGGTTPLAGTFTALTSTGNTILGDASTDTLNVGNNGLVKDASGNVLAGTTNVNDSSGIGFKLIASATAPSMAVVQSASTDATGSGYVLYSTGAGAYRFYVGAGGTIFATSTTITAISDQRLKENIRDLDYGLNEILALQPRRFDWKEGKGLDKKDDVGFIAQEFETVLPNSVGVTKAGEDSIEYKNLNHSELIPTLVKAIQEQQAMINELSSKNDILRTRLDALENTLRK